MTVTNAEHTGRLLRVQDAMAHKAAAAVEVAAWWAALVVLWLMLIGPVDGTEWAVGVPAALVGAVAAFGARRAVGRR